MAAAGPPDGRDLGDGVGGGAVLQDQPVGEAGRVHAQDVVVLCSTQTLTPRTIY